MKTVGIGLLLVLGSSLLGQTAEKAPDTLQALLAEVHQLRQDIEAMTAASQRVQIALYGLQIQDAAVSRATQRLDTVRNRCSGVEIGKQRTSAEVQKLERDFSAGTVPESVAKDFKDRLAELKIAQENQTAELQNCQVAESEASGQVRTEQGKLSELQDRISRLDKALEKFGAADKH